MRPVLIIGAAGSGKTEEMLTEIAGSGKGPWEYYAETHKLAEECAARLRLMNTDLRVVVISGRDYCPDGEKPMCAKHKQAAALVEAGQPVFPSICLRSTGNGKPATKCDHYEECPYIRQFKSADVYIYPHAYLTLERNILEKRSPYGIVIDESPILRAIEHPEFQVSLLHDPNLPDEAKRLCLELAEAITEKPETIRQLVLNATESGEWYTAQKSLQGTTVRIKPNMSDQEVNAAVKNVVTFKPVSTLLENLEQSRNCQHPPQSVEFDQTHRTITVHHRKDIYRRFSDEEIFKRYSKGRAREQNHIGIRMVLLDASASPLLIKKFIPKITIHAKPITRQAYVIQCHSTRCATSSLVPYKDSDKTGAKNATEKFKLAAKRRLNDIQQLLNRLSREGRNALVVGPSSVVGNPATGIEPQLTCPAGIEFAHYNAVRGVDRWKGCDTVVVIGRNQPPVLEVERIARALFFDDPTPLKLTGVWTEEIRGYRLKSGKKGVAVPVHADQRVQAVVEQIRECESLQAVDRIRLIYPDQFKTVILLSKLPLDIDVDELLTWKEIINGGNRFERAWAAQTSGVMPLNPAWLAEHHADLWPSVGAAKQDVGRVRRRGQTPNDIHIRNLSLFEYEYRLTGQRNWSRCLSKFPAAAQTEEALQKLLGEAVTVRPSPAVGEA